MCEFGGDLIGDETPLFLRKDKISAKTLLRRMNCFYSDLI